MSTLFSQDAISAFFPSFFDTLVLVVSVCIVGSLCALAFLAAQGHLDGDTPPVPISRTALRTSSLAPCLSAGTPPDEARALTPSSWDVGQDLTAPPPPTASMVIPTTRTGTGVPPNAIRPDIFLLCSADEMERLADLALRYERASSGLVGFPTANQLDGLRAYGDVDMDSTLAEFNEDCALYPNDYPMLPSVPLWLRSRRQAHPPRWSHTFPLLSAFSSWLSDPSQTNGQNDVWYQPGEFGELDIPFINPADSASDAPDQDAPPWGAHEGQYEGDEAQP